MKNISLIIAFFISLSCSNQNPVLNLPALLGDNMVLQQTQDVQLWGWCEPGIKINIVADWGEHAKTKTDAEGKWSTTIKTPKYGGPYSLSISANKTIETINNIMIGEVWLCSGQSNMEMPMSGWMPKDSVEHSAKEITRANYPWMRMFTVARVPALNPLSDCSGNWKECTPETAPNFSATAFFFALKLYQDLGIPVGLIHSSWGGTPAEAWTSEKYINQVEGYENFSVEMEKSQEEFKEYELFLSKLESFELSELPEVDPFDNVSFNDSLYSPADLDDSNWKKMAVPGFWEQEDLPGFDGVVWLRTEFEIPSDYYPEGFELYLGPVDDMDATYINGILIGRNEKSGLWTMERSYPIPQSVLREGKNTLSVKVTDNTGGGGIYGNGPALYKGAKQILDLSGKWKYKPAATLLGGTIYIFGEGENRFESYLGSRVNLTQFTPTSLYNGMIAPIEPYTIRGAIWYQGEGNVGRGEQYTSLFPAMINSWRDAWNQGIFPFYFVQIAPYNYGLHADNDAAELREAQLKTLHLENTGMVVTMDIGNPENIHPKKKKEVGDRLALWALAKSYGQTDLVYSGPVFKAALFLENKIELSFHHAENGLLLKGYSSFFEIAGEDQDYEPAEVILDGNKLIVFSSKISKPKYLRYAWGDELEPNLYNVEGLPASPFKAEK